MLQQGIGVKYTLLRGVIGMTTVNERETDRIYKLVAPAE